MTDKEYVKVWGSELQVGDVVIAGEWHGASRKTVKRITEYKGTYKHLFKDGVKTVHFFEGAPMTLDLGQLFYIEKREES